MKTSHGGRTLNRDLSELVTTPDRNRRAVLAGIVQADIDGLVRKLRRATVVLDRLAALGVVEVSMDDDEPIRLLEDPT